MSQLVKQSQGRSAYSPFPMKSSLGQYMTPPRIAAFMTSLFSQKDGIIHLLDPGAGQGALSRAFLKQWKNGSFSFSEGKLDAFEIDSSMVHLFKKNLEDDKLNLPLSFKIHQADFIEQAVPMILGQERPYTHAILNPPYKKINCSSRHRTLLREAGIETVNLYFGFVALAIAMLAPGGQIAAIIPRSFCNGPYYKPFRKFILRHTAIRYIHLFESRTKIFDHVLQENIILMLERDASQGDIAISTSNDDEMQDYSMKTYPFSSIIHPNDPETFFHIPTLEIISPPNSIRYMLADIGLEISTGPVVDFRLKPYLRNLPESGDAPLLYPAHFKNKTKWPIENFKKPNAIKCHPETMKWLYPKGFYVVVRRMSSKEEKRRIIANTVDPAEFPDRSWLGFENHLNVFHSGKKGIPEDLAYRLSVYLNSSLIDSIFRGFNGHTQVNATDLRFLRYPTREKLELMGKSAKKT